jgi:hypothetical protein
MEMNAFCSFLRDEISSWKAKTHDLVAKAEGNSPGQNPKMTASIDDMKAMIDRIELTIQRLEKECPVNWDSEKIESDQTMCELRERWNDTASFSPDDFE